MDRDPRKLSIRNGQTVDSDRKSQKPCKLHKVEKTQVNLSEAKRQQVPVPKKKDYERIIDNAIDTTSKDMSNLKIGTENLSKISSIYNTKLGQKRRREKKSKSPVQYNTSASKND